MKTIVLSFIAGLMTAAMVVLYITNWLDCDDGKEAIIPIVIIIGLVFSFLGILIFL